MTPLSGINIMALPHVKRSQVCLAYRLLEKEVVVEVAAISTEEIP